MRIVGKNLLGPFIADISDERFGGVLFDVSKKRCGKQHIPDAENVNYQELFIM